MICDSLSRDNLILQNSRLIHWVLKKYYGQYDGPLEHDDLVQTGMVGLIKAADSFDAEKGSFSTHAVQQIRKELQNAVLDSDLIQRPRDCTEPRKETVSEQNCDLCHMPDQGDSPAEFVEQQDWLDAHLGALTPREREVVELVVISGYTEQEAADRLGISHRRVQQLKQAAFSKLRTAIRNF